MAGEGGCVQPFPHTFIPAKRELKEDHAETRRREDFFLIIPLRLCANKNLHDLFSRRGAEGAEAR